MLVSIILVSIVLLAVLVVRTITATKGGKILAFVALLIWQCSDGSGNYALSLFSSNRLAI